MSAQAEKDVKHDGVGYRNDTTFVRKPTMEQHIQSQVRRCFDERRFDEALTLLELEIAHSHKPDWHSLYLAGQAARFLNRLEDAEKYLRSAINAGGHQQAE